MTQATIERKPSLSAEKLAEASPECVIRRMGRACIDNALAWAAAEGWNPGLNDAQCFNAADPEGFFVCQVDGKSVGAISAVTYGDDFGFIGLFVIDRKYRGQGAYALRLTRAALDHLHGRNIGLDGVPQRVADYKALGFTVACNNIRFEGTGGGRAPAGVVPLSSLPLQTVLDYDRRFFPAPRPAFMQHWLNQTGASCLGVMKGDKLSGYGVIRPCFHGYKIGPLFADGPEQAATLMEALAANAPSAPFYIDVPDLNHHGLALAEQWGMNKVFTTARMYSKAVPSLPLEGIYGVTTLELG